MVGWKDILRPIRDGLRDQLPSRSPKEDDEAAKKRRKQYESDISKGFAYFDTFDQVESWTPESVDPLQRSNTPLLPRPRSEPGTGHPKATIILIHDYSGNYHDYEDCHGSSVTKERYSCEYMQFIDTFVYFSHKLVCIPPPVWTNSLHRNGVRSLGTFLVEPQSPNIGKILERRASTDLDGGWEYPLASQLANMAKVYGFEGWLLNVEKTFPFTQWDREKMVGFMTQLKAQLGHGNVIWYDALTTNNMLQYQNALTNQNLAFAQAAGSILTNYNWKETEAVGSKKLALANNMDPRDVVFGIDVWAQNSQPKENPRHTYGGGGLNTGIAVAKLADLGLSAGIFAPAWPFEHFPNCSLEVQRSMWDGEKLPEKLGCACAPSDVHSKSDAYPTHAIARFAREFPAGSEFFFYTNFERAFSSDGGSGSIVAHLGSTSILPHLPTGPSQAQMMGNRSMLTGRLLSNPPRIAIMVDNTCDSRVPIDSLRLFKLKMTGYLELTLVYQKEETPAGLDIAIEMTGTGQNIRVPSQACSRVEIRKTLDCTESTSGDDVSILDGITIHVRRDQFEMVCMPLMEILEIRIKRQGDDYDQCAITDPGLTFHGHQRRLSWNCHAKGGGSNGSLPFSNITGAVSHFLLYIDTELTGRVYTCQYNLSEDMVAKLEGEEKHDIRIEGVGFDGKLLCSLECNTHDLKRIERSDECGGWEMV